MTESCKKQAIACIDRNAGIFTGVSDRIWDMPELSLHEHRAAALYCDTLRQAGFEVTEGICGIATAFAASYGRGRPVIGILAEYDALSGLSQAAGAEKPQPLIPGGAGHGCGHNLLGAGSLAAAFAVKEYLQTSGAEGTVVLYGCPGEEGGAAKAFMARDGLWRGLDAALAWHPSDVNEVRTGTNNSSIQVLYKFHGRPAHAAADPENGRSALDAVTLMNVGVQFLREHMSADCRVHYAVMDTGGVSPNVVQAEAAVLYMVRASSVGSALALVSRVDDIAKGAALMTGTEQERVFIDGTAELIPNYALEHLLYENLQYVGVPTHTPEELEFAAALRRSYEVTAAPGTGPAFDRAIAAEVEARTQGLSAAVCDFILPEYHGEGFMPGSTDVGDVSWQTPAAQLGVVCFPFGAPGHSWQNVSCGRTSLAHKGMLCAGKVLACTAIDIFADPDKLTAARVEFERRASRGYTCPIESDAVPIAL